MAVRYLDIRGIRDFLYRFRWYGGVAENFPLPPGGSLYFILVVH